MGKAVVGTSGFPLPQVDFTPAADPFVQQLLDENAQLKAERDKLTAINEKLTKRLTALRNGVAAQVKQIKEGK